MDSRFCSLTACLKNAKNTKGQSAICEGLEKCKNNTTIQIAFLDVMEKYQKKYTNTKCMFYMLFVFFVFFLSVYQKNTKNIQKNTKKYECNCSKIQNTKKNTNRQYQKYKIQKKIRTQKFKNTKYKKQIRTQNFKNTKYKEKTNSKISQRANPVFTFGNQEPKYKKIQNQPVVFSKPCSSDFVFLGCIFFVFFCIFKYWQKTLL